MESACGSQVVHKLTVLLAQVLQLQVCSFPQGDEIHLLFLYLCMCVYDVYECGPVFTTTFAGDGALLPFVSFRDCIQVSRLERQAG